MASEALRGVSARLSALAAAMREQRVRVGLGEVLSAHRALAAVEPGDRSQAFFALRAALCSSREDYGAFKQAFERVFEPAAAEDELEVSFETVSEEPVRQEGPQPAGEGDGESRELTPAGWSDLERLRLAD